jgi:hypothetical protein
VADRRRIQTLVLVAAAAVALAVTVTAIVLGQGSGPATGLAGLRSPTIRPSPPRSVPDGSASGVPEISGVRCDPTEQITYHVHARLLIRVGGELQAIPGTIGQQSTCIYWLHTHATDGIIHIEAPAPRDFTLGQFFDVWGRPLDATEVGDWAVPAGSKVWAFVDGQPVAGDPRAILLKDRETIELQIGPAALDPLG